MKTITAAAAAAALSFLACIGPAGAQSARPEARPATLTVNGQGSVDRTPDRAFVNFTIVTNDDVATRATSANNTAYNTLVAKLGALGLSGPALRTAAYNVAYNQRPPQPNPQYQPRYGYVVTRSVTVTSDHPEQVGAIIDAGVSAGVTDVGSVSFGLRDAHAAERAALTAAMADADAQAHAIADAAHVRIVRIFAVSANSAGTPPRPLVLGRLMVASGAPAPVPTEVAPSDLTLTASVNVTYEVAP
jgi:uncharacterized protein YggE